MAERGEPGEGRGGGEGYMDYHGISITAVPGQMNNFAQEPQHKRMRLATDGLEYSE